ncbi:claudin domain-containing protein 1-like [Clavelina lepadiformis]|uniref:claudin domain-containing protein 1-like n=1 Tax=Clavelina lepadiformis TaxID=159417 RepID=UPI0040416EE2
MVGRLCCFSIAGILCGLAVVSASLAAGTDYWYEILNKVPAQTNDNATVPTYKYPYHVGLWLTCYDQDIPDTIPNKELISGNCVLNYDFRSKHIEDFARTSAVCIVLSCGIMLASGVLGMSGCACRRSTPLLLSGIFLYVSTLVMLIGMCCFIGRILLEGEPPNIPVAAEVSTRYGWSFYLGWASVGLQLLSASMMVGGNRKCSGIKDQVNFI